MCVTLYQAKAWTQLGADIDGEAANDYSGISVSLSSDGTRVAIGATENDGSASSAGHVRVYEYSSSAWAQLGGDLVGEAADLRFGLSVSLSSNGTRVAIGAPGLDGQSTGRVQMYKYSSSGWSQLGGDIFGEAADEEFGGSVSLSSDATRLAIGAPGYASNAGRVQVYGNLYAYGADIPVVWACASHR